MNTTSLSFLLPHEVALHHWVGVQVFVAVYLLVDLSDVEYAPVDAISESFIFCKRELSTTSLSSEGSDLRESLSFLEVSS